jgi:hypothetical protein
VIWRLKLDVELDCGPMNGQGAGKKSNRYLSVDDSIFPSAMDVVSLNFNSV